MIFMFYIFIAPFDYILFPLLEFLAVDRCEIHIHLERIDKKDLPKVCCSSVYQLVFILKKIHNLN